MFAAFPRRPWEKNPQLIPNQRLDLRPFVFAFTDKSGCALAAVVATQDGRLKPRRGKSPIAKLDNAEGGPWRTVGVVAAEDEDSLSAAVEAQRGLIEAWACELIRDFKTDEKLLSRKAGRGAPPIRLAWVEKPKPWDFSWPSGFINEVPPKETPAAPDGTCGFLGSQCRSVKGAKGGFSFVSVELPP
jgi:hypothetical protein